jgi:hypothetical protein
MSNSRVNKSADVRGCGVSARTPGGHTPPDNANARRRFSYAPVSRALEGNAMFHVIDSAGDLQSPVEGLYRVVLRPCGHVLAEMLSEWQAEMLLEAINDANPGSRRRAEIVSYSAPQFATAMGGAQ